MNKTVLEVLGPKGEDSLSGGRGGDIVVQTGGVLSGAFDFSEKADEGQKERIIALLDLNENTDMQEFAKLVREFKDGRDIGDTLSLFVDGSKESYVYMFKLLILLHLFRGNCHENNRRNYWSGMYSGFHAIIERMFDDMKEHLEPLYEKQRKPIVNTQIIPYLSLLKTELFGYVCRTVDFINRNGLWFIRYQEDFINIMLELLNKLGKDMDEGIWQGDGSLKSQYDFLKTFNIQIQSQQGENNLPVIIDKSTTSGLLSKVGGLVRRKESLETHYPKSSIIKDLQEIFDYLERCIKDGVQAFTQFSKHSIFYGSRAEIKSRKK